MSSAELPPCGLYRTTAAIAGVDAGRLVYFHNHGNPGPGLYFPERWTTNRAHFAPAGTTLPEGFDRKALLALPAEGFYRVKTAFHCCDKHCVQYEPDQLLQLGYNGAGRGLLFVPELGSVGITVPERGTQIDDAAFAHLALLKLPEKAESREGKRDDINITMPRGIVIH